MSDITPIPEPDHAAVVRGLYRGFLGREPDPAGLAYWSGRLAEGAIADELLAALMGSDEYRLGHGAPGAAGLDALKARVARAASSLLARPLTVVDVGAQELENEDHIYAPLTRHGLPYRIVGFEPQQDKIEASRRNNPDSRVTLYPTFIGDGGRHIFHANNDDATSSLLPFNRALTAQLRDLDHLHTVHTEEVATSRLDDVLEDEGAVDFLKLDIQGFELPTLRHAGAVLARTGVVHCEVSFAPIYEGQALFSEIETLMRAAGFWLLDFSSLCRYPSVDSAARTRDRLGWGDAVFVRHGADAQGMLAQALVLLLVYDKPSAAQALAKQAGIDGLSALFDEGAA
ncbi:FkbM family methyltransferase [Massilia timonae]|uniref:FkbM family methyltransferase n=1 Tax=Massilia timonae CCUG 45783 TaxID=883126 RepID=K9DIV7_9BURK|nr:FkbM family methyltransferase [Massilia timonae]EKU83206.1 FkbM family methyltransferase [Massilia timonae CCUG 45783]